MYATLATPCWAPASSVSRVCLDETITSRRQMLFELRALLAEIVAPSGKDGREPIDLPVELDGALDAWLARKAA